MAHPLHEIALPAQTATQGNDDESQRSDPQGETLSWHQALCRGQDDAVDRFATYLVPVLRRNLRRIWRGWKSAFIEDAVEDAVLHYLGHPLIYDPACGTLEKFLTHNANQHMKTRLRSARRRQRHEHCAGEVLLDTLARSIGGRIADIRSPTGHAEDDLVQMLFSLTRTDEERAFIELRLEGAPVADQARALGLEELPVLQQRLGIQRVLTRLRERARRLGWRRHR
jgi:hypothetical protein